MRQRANTFHMLSETIIGKTDTHRGSDEIPSIKIARVNIKRWSKKKNGKEGMAKSNPYHVNAKTKEHYPLKAVFRCSSFLMHEGRFQAFFFSPVSLLQQVSLLEGMSSGKLMSRSKRKAHRREPSEEAASSTVKIGIHTRKYYPRHHCQGKWIKGHAIILRPSARKVKTK